MLRPRLGFPAVLVLAAVSAAVGGCAAMVEPNANPGPQVQLSSVPEPSPTPVPSSSPVRPPASPPAGNPAPD